MEPGDALFFHCNLLHRSDQNRSEHPRWSMICCYNAARNDPYKESHHPRYTPLRKVPDCGRSRSRPEALRRLDRRRRLARSGQGPERLHAGERRMKNISIAMLGSGFVADFYMQGLQNVNGQEVVLNYSRSAAGARRSPRTGASRNPRPSSIAPSRATTSTCSSSRCRTKRTCRSRSRFPRRNATRCAPSRWAAIAPRRSKCSPPR